MLVLSKRLLGVPIMSIQTGARIAATQTPIIDPRTLHIIAFYCQGGSLDKNASVLHTADIREVSDLGYIVDSSEVIMDPDELVRLQEILSFKFTLLDLPVLDDTKQKLGTIVDYATDLQDFRIYKLHVKRPLLSSLSVSELIISRNQIIEVNNKHIIVRSATVEDREPNVVEKAQASLANPFRKPQPNSIEHDQS